jgi:hypothetical protein
MVVLQLSLSTLQLTLTGITIIASSGDGGVAYSQSHECLLPNGVLSAGNPNGSFVGQLPASWYVFILVSDISPSSRSPRFSNFHPLLHTTMSSTQSFHNRCRLDVSFPWG